MLRYSPQFLEFRWILRVGRQVLFAVDKHLDKRLCCKSVECSYEDKRKCCDV